jgi:hypothetical protein
VPETERTGDSQRRVCLFPCKWSRLAVAAEQRFLEWQCDRLGGMESIDVPTARLECLLDITWPAGKSRWWHAEHTGTGAQIAAVLDELAVRIEIDHWTHILACVRRPVGYTVALHWADGTVLGGGGRAVHVEKIPAELRSHAMLLRGRLALIDLRQQYRRDGAG